MSYVGNMSKVVELCGIKTDVALKKMVLAAEGRQCLSVCLSSFQGTGPKCCIPELNDLFALLLWHQIMALHKATGTFRPSSV